MTCLKFSVVLFSDRQVALAGSSFGAGLGDALACICDHIAPVLRQACHINDGDVADTDELQDVPDITCCVVDVVAGYGST